MTENPDPYSVGPSATPPPPHPDVPVGGFTTPVPPPIDYAAQGTSISPYSGPAPTKEEQTLGMLAHLLGVIGFIGPLIIWLLKKDQSPFLNDQGKEALNFHLTMLIGYIIGAALSTVCIGFLIIPIVWIVSTIFSVMGAMKAKDGIAYRYPFALRLIK